MYISDQEELQWDIKIFDSIDNFLRDKNTGGKQIWFYRRILAIPCKQRECLKGMVKERTLIPRIKKKQLEFLGYITRKECLEKLTLTRHIKRQEGSRSPTSPACLNGWANRVREACEMEKQLQRS